MNSPATETRSTQWRRVASGTAANCTRHRGDNGARRVVAITLMAPSSLLSLRHTNGRDVRNWRVRQLPMLDLSCLSPGRLPRVAHCVVHAAAPVMRVHTQVFCTLCEWLSRLAPRSSLEGGGAASSESAVFAVVRRRRRSRASRNWLPRGAWRQGRARRGSPQRSGNALHAG